jgi:hypothetical protein
MPNQLPAMVEEQIVSFALAHPRPRAETDCLGAKPRQEGRDSVAWASVRE